MSSQLLVSRSLTGSRAVKLRKARVHRGTTHYALRKVRFLSLGIGYAAVRSFVLRTGPPLHNVRGDSPPGTPRRNHPSILYIYTLTYYIPLS